MRSVFTAQKAKNTIWKVFVANSNGREDDTYLDFSGKPADNNPDFILNTTLDYRALVDYHRQCGAILTIATHRKLVKIDLGVLQLADDQTRVSGYLEKPEYHYPVSMGVYVYDRKALDYVPRNQYFDLPSLVLRLIEKGEKVACYHNEAIWLDIGRPEDYALAQEIFSSQLDQFRLAPLSQ